VSEDFNDSSSIFFAICTHMQAWAIGVPILAVLGDSSSDGTYLGRVLLIWIFSVSSIACVVYPKLVRAIHLRRNPELRRKARVVVSGLSIATAAPIVTTVRIAPNEPIECSALCFAGCGCSHYGRLISRGIFFFITKLNSRKVIIRIAGSRTIDRPIGSKTSFKCQLLILMLTPIPILQPAKAHRLQTNSIRYFVALRRPL
jgi:hypothetical protein